MKACTAEQMREIDRRATADYGMPSLLLMENAGRAVATAVQELLAEMDGGPACSGWDRLERPRGRIRLVCGKGNNGGDGFVAARHLHNRGCEVDCYLAGEPGDVKGDARINLDLARQLGILVRPVEQFDPEDRWPRIIVDALLGTGFSGEPRGAVEAGIQAVNAARMTILSVDLPSGMDSDTGRGTLQVRPQRVVTLGLPKLGLCLRPPASAPVAIAEISLPRPLLEDAALRHEWLSGLEARWLWLPRHRSAHKGDSGRLFVLAGSVGMTGAAVMACEAALRAGAGLVTLGVPRSLADVVGVKLKEAMSLPLPETEGRAHSPESLATVRERAEAAGALAVGPGFGRDPRSGELLRGLFAGCRAPMVVDADALNLLSPADERTFPATAVLTPHPGEMARLLGTEVDAVQSNRVETALGAARRFGCVVVLKGPGTVIAAPDGRVSINSSGGPALATGGTGDVLTGIIGACLARRLSLYDAARAGVFLHGLAGEVAGERFGAPGAIAGDVIEAIPEALRRLGAGEVPLPYRIL
jgi:ADP-dependent NAD(P)H-hydrate dehydratase / NAD(P)H-hydrate epimerase